MNKLIAIFVVLLAVAATPVLADWAFGIPGDATTVQSIGLTPGM